MQLVDYEALTPVQRQQLLDIEVTTAQHAFSGDITTALYNLVGMPGEAVRGFALLVADVPQAFLLVKRGVFLAAWAHAKAATLNALQVDHRCQGQGLGRACLAALPRAVKDVWPEVECLQLSVDEDNVAGMGLYRRMGWVDDGEAYQGRFGRERRMTLQMPVAEI